MKPPSLVRVSSKRGALGQSVERPDLRFMLSNQRFQCPCRIVAWAEALKRSSTNRGDLFCVEPIVFRLREGGRQVVDVAQRHGQLKVCSLQSEVAVRPFRAAFSQPLFSLI